jgi:hypothetical protein
MILSYHATDAPEDFDVFDRTENLGYHFGTIDVANMRCVHIREDLGADNESTRIIPVYLDIKNPLRIRDHHTWDSDNVANELFEHGLIDEDECERLGEYLDTEILDEVLKRCSYDAVIYQNVTECEGGQQSDSYMITDPSKVHFALLEPRLNPRLTASMPAATPRARKTLSFR